MQNNFIRDFKVENFKRFDSLEVKNIGQFNLITGDNNVGKTSLLEALMLPNDYKYFYSTLYTMAVERDIKNYNSIFNQKKSIEDIEEHHSNNILSLFTKKIDYPLLFSKDNNLNSYFNYKGNLIKNAQNEGIDNNLFGVSGFNKLSNNWLIHKKNNTVTRVLDITSNEYDNLLTKKPGVPLLYINSKSIVQIIFNLFQNEDIRIKFEMINYLNQEFNENVLDINFLNIDDIEKEDYFHIYIYTKDKPKGFNLNNYGFGFKRMIEILALAHSDNKIICIDEFDVGIHFSRLKEFWHDVLKICKNKEIQLFATTHSQECIEAYTEALEELGMEEEGRLITLKESGETIKSFTKDFSTFKYGVENGINVLG